MEVCTNPDILRVMLFATEILKIVFIVVPIGLIIMIMVDFAKNVIANNDSDTKKNKSIAIKRIIYCIVVFLVPTIVGYVNTILGDLGVDYVACFNNANIEYINDRVIELAIDAYSVAKNEKTISAIVDAEEAIAEISDASVREPLEKQIAELRSEVKSSNSSSSNSSSGSSSNSSSGSSSSSGSTGFKNYGSGGVSGSKYFAPIQDVSSYRFGSKNSTDGCRGGSVVHDISGIKEGTPVYAAIDGTAVFYQKYCGSTGQLHSYGNEVKITGSGGTYLIYAHLQKFPDNVMKNSISDKYITKTCPKKGSSAPCPASSCRSGSTNTIATLTVKKGDLIGYVGNTGNSTGTHLHVEIHENGSSSCVANIKSAFGMS